jgi:hypothetical protein
MHETNHICSFSCFSRGPQNIPFSKILVESKYSCIWNGHYHRRETWLDINKKSYRRYYCTYVTFHCTLSVQSFHWTHTSYSPTITNMTPSSTHNRTTFLLQLYNKLIFLFSPYQITWLMKLVFTFIYVGRNRYILSHVCPTITAPWDARRFWGNISLINTAEVMATSSTNWCMVSFYPNVYVLCRN